MIADPAFATLRAARRIHAVGALAGDSGAVAALGQHLHRVWRVGDRLVVLGNMLGAVGDSAQTLDWLLALRRRLLARPGARACDVVFLRGAQEEMWARALRLAFALRPLEVLDWMLSNGLAAAIESYGVAVNDGRVACRNGPSAIARWTAQLREAQARRGGHAELMTALRRAAFSEDGALVFAAAGVDPMRSPDKQGDAFWWNARDDAALTQALRAGADPAWATLSLLVRGVAPDRAAGAWAGGPVLTVSDTRPALVTLAPDGAVLERVVA